jgi:hypothetical protein
VDFAGQAAMRAAEPTGTLVRSLPVPDPPRSAAPDEQRHIVEGPGAHGYQGDVTGHGFRALTMSTLKEILGYWHDVVDRQFALMQKDKLETAYDRANYLEERRAMMQRWADYNQVVVEALRAA